MTYEQEQYQALCAQADDGMLLAAIKRNRDELAWKDYWPASVRAANRAAFLNMELGYYYAECEKRGLAVPEDEEEGVE